LLLLLLCYPQRSGDLDQRSAQPGAGVLVEGPQVV